MSASRALGRYGETFSLNFVGVGPQRTGTSWLCQILHSHPALCVPRSLDEPMFFDRYYHKGLEWYAGLFSHCSDSQLCGEVSPTYFDADAVPARVRSLNPEIKIIINLRNPVARAQSLYRHHLSKGRIQGSFSQAILQMPRIVESGKYSKHLPRWIDVFGKDQVLFVWLDDISIQPDVVIEEICGFLRVSRVEISSKEKVNAITQPRFPRLAKLTARFVTWSHPRRIHKIVELGKKLGLRRFIYEGSKKKMPSLTQKEKLRLLAVYEQDISFLEKLLDRDLSAWRRWQATEGIQDGA